jgi:hypothetical protein
MERFFLSLGTIAFCTAGCSLMARGWRSRLGRQTDVAAPPVSDGTGMLVLTWQLGDRELATAFRADDPAAHSRLRIAVTEALLEAA